MLTDVLEDESNEGFRFCLKETTDRSTINKWSRLCERRLANSSTVNHVRERHADPTALGRIVGSFDSALPGPLRTIGL